ncbi:hypothetical protein M2272_005775 [Mycobacterium frederiksbergense]|uniref:Chitin-binding protein n=1 Tax=Mycolicibacterium frederiksbergense TaxID=117567 RepID=A0ABT6L825_9MYCO|nr:hypothetical protein [Mycolicibacterium frederiksbergense]MDH6199107.1 hypothetical protein [Mycolicibacterium frederiksbergense]
MTSKLIASMFLAGAAAGAVAFGPVALAEPVPQPPCVPTPSAPCTDMGNTGPGGAPGQMPGVPGGAPGQMPGVPGGAPGQMPGVPGM